ncbi:MAG: hypothetical protein AAB610_03445 [Patescibacteria group bacterium]
MQIETQIPSEVIRNLSRYRGTQRITVVVQKTDGSILAGELVAIRPGTIEVQDVGEPAVILIGEIKNIQHSKLLECMLSAA